MEDANRIPRKLWQHADPKSTTMWKFMQKANQERGLNMQVSFHTPRLWLHIVTVPQYNLRISLGLFRYIGVSERSFVEARPPTACSHLGDNK